MADKPPIMGMLSSYSYMNMEEITHFVNGLPDMMIGNMPRQDVISHQRIQRQLTAEEDGYPVRSTERPITWPVNDLIADELEYLQENLFDLGIDEVKVGTEVEFNLSSKSVLNNTIWLEKKEQFLEQLSREIEGATPEKRAQLEEKQAAISDFSARDILMYDLVEQDEKTRDILELIFGTSRDGTGYYDGKNILELKLKPVSPEQQIKNRKILLDTLYKKAAEYGLILKNNPSYHLNLSFWENEQNVFDPKNPEFTTKGKNIVEGMTIAAYDCLPTLHSTENLNKELHTPVSLSVNRTSFLRFSTGRVELRSRATRDTQDNDAYLIFMLAGAVHGLKDSPDLLPAKQVTKAVIHHTPDHCGMVSHVLNNAVIDDNGYIIPPEKYVLNNAKYLALEMGIIKEHNIEHISSAPGISKIFSGPTGEDKYAPHILEFFKNTRIDSISGKIIFPTTDGNVETFASASDNHADRTKSYKISTPKDYGHLLPEKLRKHIQKDAEKKGTPPRDAVNAVAYKYMLEQDILAKSIGDDPSNIDQTYTIDVSAIEKDVRLTGTTPAFVVDPGYDINDILEFEDHPKPIASARLHRMLESKVLEETSPEFHDALKQTLIEKFPKILDNHMRQDTTYDNTPEHF